MKSCLNELRFLGDLGLKSRRLRTPALLRHGASDDVSSWSVRGSAANSTALGSALAEVEKEGW